MTQPQLDPALLGWIAARRSAVLVTLRADGSPQTSNVVYEYDAAAGVARVSVTDGRAKTHNLRRDPRAVLHVLGDDFWSYASVSVTASLSAVSTTPGDDTGRTLLALRDAISDQPHPDPDEFFAAMVDERRLLLALTPTSAVAMGITG